MYLHGFCQSIWLLTGIPLSFIYTSFLKKLYTYNLSMYCYPHKKISEILPLHSGIIVVLSNK